MDEAAGQAGRSGTAQEDAAAEAREGQQEPLTADEKIEGLRAVQAEDREALWNAVNEARLETGVLRKKVRRLRKALRAERKGRQQYAPDTDGAARALELIGRIRPADGESARTAGAAAEAVRSMLRYRQDDDAEEAGHEGGGE